MTVQAGRRSSTRRSAPASPRAAVSTHWATGRPTGFCPHCAGPTDDGWRVIDVWESEEAFQRFGEVIGLILEDVGFAGEPRLFPIQNFVK